MGENSEVWLRSCASLKHELARYEEVVEQLSDQLTIAALCHLRKTSGSVLTRANSQPFLYQGLAFAHNGTVFDADKLEHTSPRQGNSDSEQLFLFIAERVLEHGLEDGTLAALRDIRGHSWTALNFVLTDGRALAAYREYDEGRDHIDVRRRYYELHYTTEADAVTVSSQPMANGSAVWQEMPNYSLLLAREGRHELLSPSL